jgi:hypothetical protein
LTNNLQGRLLFPVLPSLTGGPGNGLASLSNIEGWLKPEKPTASRPELWLCPCPQLPVRLRKGPSIPWAPSISLQQVCPCKQPHPHITTDYLMPQVTRICAGPECPQRPEQGPRAHFSLALFPRGSSGDWGLPRSTYPHSSCPSPAGSLIRA